MAKKVLVVEDEFLNMVLVRDLLAIHGYIVIEAETGEEALELLNQNIPDLILMDLQLPRMDGYTVLKNIKGKEELKNIPIVALTASVMTGDREKVLSEGFDGYIPKPINTKEFPRQIESFLR